MLAIEIVKSMITENGGTVNTNLSKYTREYSSHPWCVLSTLISSWSFFFSFSADYLLTDGSTKSKKKIKANASTQTTNLCKLQQLLKGEISFGDLPSSRKDTSSPPKKRSCLRDNFTVETIEIGFDDNSTEVVVASATSVSATDSASTDVSPLATLPYKEKAEFSHTTSVAIAVCDDGVEISDGAGR